MAAVEVVSLQEIVEALADQISDNVAAQDLGGEALQVWPYMVLSPTPPCVDMYPGDPFLERDAMGPQWKVWFTVRARAKPVDFDASQQMLLQLIDPRAATSIQAAILADETLGGRVQYANPTGPSGVQPYPPLMANEGYLVGCDWRVEILL
jgi:hypothetical protein